MRYTLSWLMIGIALPGSMLLSRNAAAQAASDCYYDSTKPNAFPSGRMVDAAPLSGQMRSTPETTAGLHYLQYLPNGHDPTKKWPVIVFLHGSGEIADTASDATLINLTKHSLPRIVEDPSWNWPFIVISPQIDHAGWLSHADQVSQTLDYVAQNYGGDPNRFYITGLSYGGVGTFALGIALADKLAAIMPVTPGGSVDNWDQRSAIVNMPIWLFNGTIDTEYDTNSGRVMDLEQSGASAFFRYDYAYLDEYNDVVPMQALTEKHIFGSYENIGHDVWHAAYGIYCPNPPTLLTKKTVQYEWLLKQSRDGSPFVDPRNPTPPQTDAGSEPDSGAAGTPGSGGSAGSPVATGGAAESTGGTAGNGGTANSPDSDATAGTSSSNAGSPSSAGKSGESTKSHKSSGCQLSASSNGTSGLQVLLGLSAFAALRRKRNK